MENKDLIQRLLKRVEYLEGLEHIKHPDHIREVINDLTDRMNELEYKLDRMKEL